jgi:hypothetical protein
MPCDKTTSSVCTALHHGTTLHYSSEMKNENEEKVKVIGKVVPVIFLTEQHATKAYWGAEV